MQWTCIHDIQPHLAASVESTGKVKSNRINGNATANNAHRNQQSTSSDRKVPPSDNGVAHSNNASQHPTSSNTTQQSSYDGLESESHDSSISSDDSGDDDDDDDDDDSYSYTSEFGTDESLGDSDFQFFENELPTSVTVPFRHSIQNIDMFAHLMSAMIQCDPPLPRSVLHPVSRLTHYIPEPNHGSGYIKEACFSPDGRIICSPFAHSIRLLAFNEDVSELCDCVPDQSETLYELRTSMSHLMPVLCTKFSPNQHIIASGSMDGDIHFHQPVL